MNAQIDITDPWRGLYTAERLHPRCEYGQLIHPDLPFWPDDREEGVDKLVRAQGFDIVAVAGDFTTEALEDGDELYWEEMRAWNPEAPEGDWRLAWMGETEDGPYAWFVRPMALRPEVMEFQAGVADWARKCFSRSLYCNMTERGDRLLEEVVELLQSKGYDSARVRTLVDYVYGRPVGEPAQEVGGVMVTLAAFCSVAGLDMKDAGDAELARIAQPEVMAKIRQKQQLKDALHFDTPLPGDAARQPVGQDARALFEAYRGGDFERDAQGYYTNARTAQDWAMWQAATAARQPAGEVIEYQSYHGYGGGQWSTCDKKLYDNGKAFEAKYGVGQMSLYRTLVVGDPAPPAQAVDLGRLRTQVADVLRGEFDLEVADPEDHLHDDGRGEADRIAGMIVALLDSGKAVGNG